MPAMTMPQSRGWLLSDWSSHPLFLIEDSLVIDYIAILGIGETVKLTVFGTV